MESRDTSDQPVAELADGSSARHRSRLADVLVSEHRQRRTALLALQEQARHGPVDATSFERSVLGLGAHLAGETVITDPVIRDVLERPDHFGLYQVEVRLIMRTLERAGSELHNPGEFASAIEDALRGYSNLAYRGELEVLTFLHHAYTAPEQRRLATSYPVMCERILRRYRQRRSLSKPAWSDHDLVPSLQGFFREEVGNEIPEHANRGPLGWRRSTSPTVSSRRGPSASRRARRT